MGRAGLIQNRLTADGSITGAVCFKGWLRQILITCDSGGVGFVYIYDDSGGVSGNPIFSAAVGPGGINPSVGTGYANGESTYPFPFPGAGVRFENGMYLDMSGGVTVVQAYWDS